MQKSCHKALTNSKKDFRHFLQKIQFFTQNSIFTKIFEFFEKNLIIHDVDSYVLAVLFAWCELKNLCTLNQG
jgi:hypothetical protein